MRTGRTHGAGQGPSRAGSAARAAVLAAHVQRRGVRPHPQVHGMAQHLVGRPARELHLDDEARLDPVGRLVGRGHRRERRLAGRDRVQVGADGVEVGLGESGPHVAGVDQPLRRAPRDGGRRASRGRGAPARRRPGPGSARVVADQQGAESAARRAALGPSPDHELLPPHELELPPRGAPSARQVLRRGVLDEQPLPVAGQRLAAQVDAAADPARHHPHHPAGVRVETLDESSPALGQRPRAQVLPPVPDQVERHQHGRGVGRARVGPT